LRTLKNLNATRARKAYGQFYNDGDATIVPDPAAAADAAAAAGNGPIQGQGGIMFKDTAAARCQLCKIHQPQISKKTPDRG
jgi:hypothetical protein